MATQVIMPKLSPTMEEGQLSRWLKKEGEKVSMGEPLAEVDTDKATMEMQALSNGVLRKILINEGESAPLGQIIAIIGEPDEDISALVSQAAAGNKKTEESGEVKAKPTAVPPQPQPKKEPLPVSGGDGIRKPEEKDEQETSRLVVSPLAARMAAEAGIDLRSLAGTGPAGRIVKRDIEAALKGTSSAPAATEGRHLRVVEAPPLQPSPTFGASRYRDEPAAEMRRTIAKRLVTSLGPVPHFFLTTEVEMDQAAEMRRSINSLDPELKISFNDLIIKVAATALLQHPQVNASFQEKNIRYYEDADIGVAVAIDDGLITPIVRSANRKSLGVIAREVRDLAERARSRKLRPEEYQGATFSVSNLGMFGIDEFTAIINPPEGAILAVGAITPKPVVRSMKGSDGEVGKNEIVIRQVMRVTLSCDHRVIDGATGAKFLQTLKNILEHPVYLMV